MDTEILATSAVKERIGRTKYLSPFINERDKEPSWDGCIYAYEDDSRKKDKLVGRAAVQIKGMQNKLLTQKSIIFRMDRTDLENYRTDGGIILFVVYIRPDFQKSIYYASLTPFYLNEILTANGKKKKPKFSMRVLPENPDELCNIVFNFIRDSKKQSIVRDGHIWTFEEVFELFGADNVEFNFSYTGIGYERKDPFAFLCQNDIYIYAQNKNKTIAIPIQRFQQFDMQVREQDAKIEVGEIEHIEKLRIAQHSNGKVECHIGKGFSYIAEKGNSVFQYHLVGNLDERIRIIEILLEMIVERYIKINSVKMDLFPDTKELKKIDLEALKRQLKFYKIVKETLDKLHVRVPFEIERLTDKEEKYLYMLIDSILYNRTISFGKNRNIPPVCTLNVANLRIVLAFYLNKDGEYKIEDFFSTEMCCSLEGDIKYRTSPFCVLKKDDYLQDSNLVLEKVIDGFKNFDNEGHFRRLDFCIMEIIKAYDEDNKRGDLLKAAKSLCLWLAEKKPYDIIPRLNYLQCCKRERDLDDTEIDELTNMLLDNATDDSVLAGIHILLDSKAMVKKYLDKLDVNQREEFEKYPIYALYRK